MSQSRVRTRIYHPDTIHQGMDIQCNDIQSHKLSTVLRCRKGETVAFFNAIDGVWHATIKQVSRKGVTAVVERQDRRPENENALTLLFAPLKRQPMTWMLEKATELGATLLQPIITNYTQVHSLSKNKLLTTLIEATEQCGRLAPPCLQTPLHFDDVLRDWPETKTVYACVEAGDSQPLAPFLQSPHPGGHTFLIGPEGGFDSEEHATIRAHPAFHPVGLGPRILRAETAAIHALSLYQGLAGDGQQPPP